MTNTRQETCPSCGGSDNNPYVDDHGQNMRACGRCMVQWVWEPWHTPAAEPQTPPVASLTCQQRLSEACVAAAKEIAVDNELGDDGVRDNADTIYKHIRLFLQPEPAAPPVPAFDEWICEDELPKGYPYKQMFPFSKLGQDGLGGVRVFPKLSAAPPVPAEPRSAELAPAEPLKSKSQLAKEIYSLHRKLAEAREQLAASQKEVEGLLAALLKLSKGNRAPGVLEIARAAIYEWGKK